ncbi:MAG: hypothetical protein AAFZ15_10895, partial [Bacteroidota bacterium]
ENWADEHGIPSSVRRNHKKSLLRKIVGKSELVLRTRNLVKAGAANVFGAVGRTVAAAADYATSGASEGGATFKRAHVTSTCPGDNNSVWVGYSDGMLRLWNSGVRFLVVNTYMCGLRTYSVLRPMQICVAKVGLGRKALKAICQVQDHLWVGSKLGLLFVIELSVSEEDENSGSTLSLTCISAWRAHQNAILHIHASPLQMVSSDTAGNIRSWSKASPIQRDKAVELELQRSKAQFTSSRDITIFTTTWNVNETKPSDISVAQWLRGDAEASDVVVVGLQEIETGGGAVVGQAVKNVAGNMRNQMMKPSAMGAWWLSTLNRHLTELGGVRQCDPFCLVGSKQLAGILLCVWVRTSIREHTSEPTSAVVTCGGPGRTLANKGVVGISLCIHRQRVTFLNSHLAAHQHAVDARNEDYHHILNNIHFYAQSHLDVQDTSIDTQPSESVRISKLKKIGNDHSLVDSELVFWIGDLNYRIDAPYEVRITSRLRHLT